MDRRDFLRLSGASAAAVGTSTIGAVEAEAASVCSLVPNNSAVFNLQIDDIEVEMIDGQRFPFLSYRLASSSGTYKVPGPVMRVVEGRTVTISIFNGRPETHGFEISGIPGSKATVLPNRTCTVTFTAPKAGTYFYYDGAHPTRHLYRLLGLHGAFIVHPVDGMTRLPGETPSITPYSIDKETVSHSEAAHTVSTVFNAFGTIPRFPGGKWVPCALDQPHSNQEKIWIFNQVDPRFNALIRPTGIAGSTLTISSAALLANFLPRYFTINGRSGYDLTEGQDMVAANWIGEPTLIRTINVGLAHHATHIHGNHVLELAHSSVGTDGFKFKTPAAHSLAGEVVLHDYVYERDVWPTAPMQSRDMLLPFEVPPDIPNWDVFEAGTNQEPFPMRYVMHCHCEMSQTAAGGNYPQGAVTHWQIMGPVGGRARS
jgi:hypothetical protein